MPPRAPGCELEGDVPVCGRTIHPLQFGQGVPAALRLLCFLSRYILLDVFFGAGNIGLLLTIDFLLLLLPPLFFGGVEGVTPGIVFKAPSLQFDDFTHGPIQKIPIVRDDNKGTVAVC